MSLYPAPLARLVQELSKLPALEKNRSPLGLLHVEGQAG